MANLVAIRAGSDICPYVL